MAARKTRRKKTKGGVSCRLCGKGGFPNAASVYWHHVHDHGKKHGGVKAAKTKKANGLPSRPKKSVPRSRSKRPLSKDGYWAMLRACPTADLWAALQERFEI